MSGLDDAPPRAQPRSWPTTPTIEDGELEWRINEAKLRAKLGDRAKLEEVRREIGDTAERWADMFHLYDAPRGGRSGDRGRAARLQVLN